MRTERLKLALMQNFSSFALWLWFHKGTFLVGEDVNIYVFSWRRRKQVCFFFKKNVFQTKDTFSKGKDFSRIRFRQITLCTTYIVILLKTCFCSGNCLFSSCSVYFANKLLILFKAGLFRTSKLRWYIAIGFRPLSYVCDNKWPSLTSLKFLGQFFLNLERFIFWVREV